MNTWYEEDILNDVGANVIFCNMWEKLFRDEMESCTWCWNTV